MTAPRLVPSQLRLLRLIAGGRRTREISELLGNRPSTVDQSLMTLRRHFGARTNAQMAARAVAYGLIRLEPRR